MSTDYVVKQAGASSTFRNGGGGQLGRAGDSKRGLEKALATSASLLDQYAGIVYWLAWYITEDNKDAEDVLQRTWLKADSDSAKSRQNESSVAWLLGIALSESFAKLRIRDAAKLLRLSLEAEADVAFVSQEAVDWDDDVVKSYRSEELRRIVGEGIQSLAPFSRIVFLLRDVAKLRTEEIADLFHLPVASVKSHSFRSRLQLREHLNKHFKSKIKETAQTA
jgi:RNA polymerase sigma-70 factor (ECF subfamily)